MDKKEILKLVKNFIDDEYPISVDIDPQEFLASTLKDLDDLTARIQQADGNNFEFYEEDKQVCYNCCQLLEFVLQAIKSE